MKSSNAYELVRSLEMSEKRHFRIFSKRHVIGEKNKYTELFDILEHSDEFTEPDVRHQMSERGHSTAYIKADQNYLYHLLLRSLAEFHQGKTAAMEIRQKLDETELLYSKGLFRQCYAEIVKAKELCKKFEYFELLQSVLYWERKVLMHTAGSVRRAKDVVEEQLAVSRIYSNLLEYTMLYEKALAIRARIIHSRSARDLKDAEDFFGQALIRSEKEILSENARIRFLQIAAIRHNIKGDKKRELKCNEDILLIMREKLDTIREFPLDYVNVYSRVLSIVKDFAPESFSKELQRFRSFSLPPGMPGSKRVMAQVFNFSYMMELSHLISSSSFRKAFELCDKVEEGYAAYSDYITDSSRITLLYMLAYVYYANGELKAARKKINSILTGFQKNVRPELMQFTRLLNILCHYDLRNFRVVQSEVSSVRYYFQKNKQEYKTENIMLRFFSKPDLYKQAGRAEFEYLRSELMSVQDVSMEKLAFRYFDFSSWAYSKMQRRNMAEVIVR